MTRRIPVLLLCVALIAGLTGCFEPAGPRARFTATPQFGYPPLETTFDASSSTSPNGAILSYEWAFGDGETGTGRNVTHTYAEKGTYQVTLLITDSNGDTGAWSDAVQVLNKLPTARFTFSPFWVYAGNDATFDASDSYDEDGEIVQYLWSFGDGSTGEGMVVEHAFPFSPEGGPWIATVTLTVIDEDGGSTTTFKQINVRGCATCG